MAAFQIKLGGEWRNYEKEEDKIIKRAFMAGFPSAKFHLRGQDYEYNFKDMEQINKETGKRRQIRPPHGWKPPSKPIVPAGPTITVTVPPGSQGKIIQVPHPKQPGLFIDVSVPARAKPGQAMLVPVPSEGVPKRESDEPVVAGGGSAAGGGGGGGGWSTGAKVAAGGAAVVGVGGLAVAGALLGTSIAEHGAEATFDGIADGAGTAAEAVGDFAGDAVDVVGDFGADAGEFIVDAGESAGDFIMDLF
eukprot:TRINITY_DN105_c0_g1_i1.p1 TRINITY_DN105_c0_g1~~TRINITY_DN105_c0_g1_i1.p1  ORF type:complete len:248 (-),score=58.17 TRINITY_DN105_c0_g1_i1:120-863(-)